jgi:hypothetical protein
MASRIAARSTIAGTPVKSCISTRLGVNAISMVGGPAASQFASAAMSSRPTASPSSVRSRFSSSTLNEKGRRETSKRFSSASRRKISSDRRPTSSSSRAPKESGCSAAMSLGATRHEQQQRKRQHHRIAHEQAPVQRRSLPPIGLEGSPWRGLVCRPSSHIDRGTQARPDCGEFEDLQGALSEDGEQYPRSQPTGPGHWDGRPSRSLPGAIRAKPSSGGGTEPLRRSAVDPWRPSRRALLPCPSVWTNTAGARI